MKGPLPPHIFTRPQIYQTLDFSPLSMSIGIYYRATDGNPCKILKNSAFFFPEVHCTVATLRFDTTNASQRHQRLHHVHMEISHGLMNGWMDGKVSAKDSE